MTKNDLRVGQVWKARADGELRTVIHAAVAGCGDSVAWRNSDGTEGGGSGSEFVAAHALLEASGYVPPVEKCVTCGAVWSIDCPACAKKV